jgi:8-oxo-dGTP pyrophosphatase MutT (NUDIX family)
VITASRCLLRHNSRVSETEYPARLAGRVVTIDPAGRVLLFRYQDPPPKGDHWTTPGGGVEAGEDFYAAACRELVEETGWSDVPVAPQEVLLDVNVQFSGSFMTLVRQHDHYFIAPVATESRPLGSVAAMHETDGIKGHRWWTLDELDATGEAVYPPGLADLVRRYLPASS